MVTISFLLTPGLLDLVVSSSSFAVYTFCFVQMCEGKTIIVFFSLIPILPMVVSNVSRYTTCTTQHLAWFFLHYVSVFFVPFSVSIEKPSMPSSAFDGGKGTILVTFGSKYTKNVTEFLISSCGGVITRSLLSFSSLQKTLW